MRSMHRFFILALAVGVLALFAAGTAFAEAKVVGYVAAGLGQYTTDSATVGSTPTGDPTKAEEVSDIQGQSEAQIDVLGGTGNVTARYRLRVRQNAAPNASGGSFAAVRHQVSWKVNDAFNIDFYGQSYGHAALLNAYFAYSIGHFTHGAPIGDTIVQDGAFYVNRTGVNLAFTFGTMQAGLIILEDDGGIGAATAGGGTAATANNEDQTLAPWFLGKFGPATVGLVLASASGKVGTGSTALDASASQNTLTVRFKQGTMDIGFEYAVAEKGELTPRDHTNMGLGGKFGPIGFHYVTKESESSTGVAVSDITEISLAYVMPLTEQGELAIMLATQESGLAATENASASYFAVSGKTSF